MRSHKTLTQKGLAFVLSAATMVALAGCTSSNAAGGSDGLNIVATTTQVQDFTQEIGGDAITLTGLLKPGASAHHFDPSPADLAALKDADALVINGAGLEEFLDSAIEASGFDGEIIDAAEGVEIDGETAAHLAEEGGHEDHERAEEDHDHAEEGNEHGDESHDHAEEEHDHSHDAVNPHLWTSPHNAEGMVNAIASGLEELDPENAETFAGNAEAYTSKLAELDEWISSEMDKVPEAERQFTSQHDALHYYLDAYGVTFIGSVIPSFEDNAEPSAAEIDELVAKIKEQHVSAIFVESSVSPKLAETVAKESGAKVVDEPIYADSLATDGDAATYIGATIANTETLLQAWGTTPESVPSSLQ